MQLAVYHLFLLFLSFATTKCQYNGQQPYGGYGNIPCGNARYPQQSVSNGYGQSMCQYGSQYRNYPQNYQPSYQYPSESTVKTEYIDVSPDQFREYIKGFKGNLNIIPDRQYTQQYQPQYQQYQPQYQQYQPQYFPSKPKYIVKTTSSHNDDKNKQPQSYTKHEVQNKVFKFSNTYVLTPEDRNREINLNFVNGVPVARKEDLVATTTETTTTTTEETVTEPETDEFPDGVNNFVNIDGSVLRN